MKYRKIGKTNFQILEVSLGKWQVGGKWGEVFDKGETFSGKDTQTHQ